MLSLVAYLFLVFNVKSNIFDVISPPAYFYAPYTPFLNDDAVRPTVNIDAIKSIVDTAIDSGVNIFWIGGSNGQFTALSVQERKDVCKAYVEAINNHSTTENIYSIFHVGATRIDESVELSGYAQECGVNAIGSLPPYYNTVSSSSPFTALFTWFRPIISASNGMPFWYYHYPGRTNYNINIYDLLQEAKSNGGLPEIEGIKFNNDDTSDYFRSTEAYSDSIAIIPYYSPSLALFSMDKGFGFGSSDFMMPVVQCMKIASDRGDTNAAYWYQEWIYNTSSIYYPNAVGNRCLYQRVGVPTGFDMGPPRPPLLPYTQQQCDDLNSALDDIGFFNQLVTIKNDVNCNPFTP